MLMTRRSFLGTILAAAVAPAIVRADSLMRVVPRNTLVLVANPAQFVKAPLIRFESITEEACVEVYTLLCDTKRTITGYGYYAVDTEVLVPPNADSSEVYADGRPFDMRGLDHTLLMDPGGVPRLRFERLPLNDYGCRIPEFSFKVREESNHE